VWREFIAARHVDYEYLGYARQQVTVRIGQIGLAT